MADVPGGPIPPPPPPPPMVEGPHGGIPPKTLGKILSAAFNIYKANAAKLIVIVAVVVVPLSFISALVSGVVFVAKKHQIFSITGQPLEVVSSRGFFAAIVVGGIAVAISVIIWAVLEAAIMRAAAEATIGDPVDAEASYRYGFKRIGSVLLVSVLVGLVVLGGFILLVIPGFIFLVMLGVSIPALIVENRRGTDAMSRSWNLVKGHFWHAFGVIFVAGLIAGVVSGIIGAIGGNAWVARWIFTAIGTIATAPFSALVSVLLYLDLRARSESLSATTLRSELAANT
jgi:hypothetical protein